jgi:hypothetical protein
MSVKGHIKEAAGFVKEEANEHGKSANSQAKAQEGRNLRNEGGVEDGNPFRPSQLYSSAFTRRDPRRFALAHRVRGFRRSTGPALALRAPPQTPSAPATQCGHTSEFPKPPIPSRISRRLTAWLWSIQGAHRAAGALAGQERGR